MAPYAPLRVRLLPPGARRTLVTHVKFHHFIDVVDHMSTRGVPDGLSFLPTPIIERLIPDALARLRESCPLPFAPHVYVFRPGWSIAPHTDGRTEVRQCAIIDPLYPYDSPYAPTLFWDGDTVSHKLERGDGPALVNLQIRHSVSPSKNFRINFQMAFGTPFDQALTKLVNWQYDCGEEV